MARFGAISVRIAAHFCMSSTSPKIDGFDVLLGGKGIQCHRRPDQLVCERDPGVDK
jgi:hypothetical protein